MTGQQRLGMEQPPAIGGAAHAGPHEDDGITAADAAAAATADAIPPRQPWADTTLQQLRAELQHFADERNWGQFHTPRNLLLALTGEVGELAEIFQWRGDAACGSGLPGFSKADRQHVGEELSDVLLYLVRLADACGVDLPAAALDKMEKNRAKYPVHLAHGSAAKYTELARQAQQAQHGEQQGGQQAQHGEEQGGQQEAAAAARAEQFREAQQRLMMC